MGSGNPSFLHTALRPACLNPRGITFRGKAGILVSIVQSLALVLRLPTRREQLMTAMLVAFVNKEMNGGQ